MGGSVYAVFWCCHQAAALPLMSVSYSYEEEVKPCRKSTHMVPDTHSVPSRGCFNGIPRQETHVKRLRQ